MKKISKLTKTIIAASFFLSIFAFFTPVMAIGSSRIVIMAKGDDLDFSGATNVIMGKIDYGKGDGLPSVQIFFHSKIYDEAGAKVYAMMGMTNKGVLLTDKMEFLCPLYDVYWINVSFIEGQGTFKTTALNYEVFFRNFFQITMPNTEGKYVPATIFMMISFVGEYCTKDPTVYPPGSSQNPILIWPGGGWAIAGVEWEVQTQFGPLTLPVGPASYLTK